MRESRLTNLLAEAEQHALDGRMDTAISCYEKILSGSLPGEYFFELAQYRLGTLYLQLGDWMDAAKHLLSARKLNPDESVYALTLGISLREAGQYNAANSHLFDAINCLRWRWVAMGELALSALYEGDRKTARHLVGIAVQQRPDDPVLQDIIIRCSDA